MSYFAKDLSNPERIYTLVMKHGVAIIPNYRPEQCLAVQEKCEEELSNANSSYGFGAVVRYNGVPKWLSELYDDELKAVADLYYNGKKYSLHNEVFLAHEYKSDGYARNSDLHFDRRHALKFFYYLIDVDERCGPFSIAPGSHQACKKFRIKESGKPYDKQLNRTKEIPELQKYEKEVMPVVGQIGTLIVFDTDVLHKGGHVDEGHERMIVRSHCRYA